MKAKLTFRFLSGSIGQAAGNQKKSFILGQKKIWLLYVAKFLYNSLIFKGCIFTYSDFQYFKHALIGISQIFAEFS
ncbi:hypothetical protein D0T49_03530 [Paludibacter sp. 221]|nr:hypothetical protein [Paludibacter sp. 221]